MESDASSNLGVLLMFLCVSLTVTKKIPEATLIGHNIPFFECKALCCESSSCRSFHVDILPLTCHHHTNEDQETTEEATFKTNEGQKTIESELTAVEKHETDDGDAEETRGHGIVDEARLMVKKGLKVNNVSDNTDKVREEKGGSETDSIGWNLKLTGVVIGSCKRLIKLGELCPFPLKVMKEYIGTDHQKIKQNTKVDGEKRNDVTRIGDWVLLFRGTADINQTVYDLWMNDVIVDPKKIDPGCLTLMTSTGCKQHFKSKLINRWKASDIEMVKYLILKNDAVKAEIHFNGTGSNKTSWFSKSRVIESSWTDLTSSLTNFFSIEGHSNNRRFFINHKYGGCKIDQGWTTTLDSRARKTGGCKWDFQTSFPKFMYSKLDMRATIAMEHEIEYGDAIVVLAKQRKKED